MLSGEIPSIDMLVLNQTQFTPLPEALCIIISDLNQARALASFDIIMEKLGETYKGLHQPSEQIVYETLDSLLNERKLYHTGNLLTSYLPVFIKPGFDIVLQHTMISIS